MVLLEVDAERVSGGSKGRARRGPRQGKRIKPAQSGLIPASFTTRAHFA
jgi:hypothetical protein